MSKIVQSEQVSAICSLVASMQRSSGIWRLQEVIVMRSLCDYSFFPLYMVFVLFLGHGPRATYVVLEVSLNADGKRWVLGTI